MLASAGARLLRPKLAASLALWRQGWDAEMRARRRRGLRRCCARRIGASAARWRASSPRCEQNWRRRGRAGAVGGDRDGRSGGRATRTARAHGGGGAHEGGGGGSRAAGEAGGGEGAAGRAPAARGGEADRPRRRRAQVERVARRVGERRRQRQMLASAGARLLRPKLAASVAHWRGAWEAARAEERSRAEALLSAQARGCAPGRRRWSGCGRSSRRSARAPRRSGERRRRRRRSRRRGRRRRRRAAADRSAGGGEGEADCAPAPVAARRMGNQGILRGWTAWVDLHEEQRARRQMLASAGARLLRPKLAASLALWRQGWEAEMRASAEKGLRRCCARRMSASAARWRASSPGCVQNWRRRGPSWRGRRRPRRPQRRTSDAHCTSAWRRRCSRRRRRRLASCWRGWRRRRSGGSSTCGVAARRIGLGAVARGWSVARRVGGAAATAADAGERWRAAPAAEARGERRALARGLEAARAEERSRAEALLSAAQARGARRPGGGGGAAAGGARGGSARAPRRSGERRRRRRRSRRRGRRRRRRGS